MQGVKQLQVAIVHDVLDQYGGAERVLKGLLKIWPKADLYVSRFTKNPQTKYFEEYPIHTSFMQNLPFFKQLAKFYTPLYPLAFESFNLSNYDLIISSTAHFAKAVLTTPEQLHICYCHTPPRFLYHYPSESQTRHKLIFKPFVLPLDHYLRLYDFQIAQRPDFFLTNSKTTAERIKKFYQREAKVVHPPVNFKRIQDSRFRTQKGNYFLVVSRLIAYKNIDTVIQAFTNTRDLTSQNWTNKSFSAGVNERLRCPKGGSLERMNPDEELGPISECAYCTDKLIIVGTGPEEEKLKNLTGSSRNIEFVGFVSEEKLIELYQNARAVIFSAADEDFGIVPIEAMAAGTPVIALQSGGVQETVIENETGIFYEQNDPIALQNALNRFKKHADSFQPQKLIAHAAKFSQENFEKQIRAFVEEKLREKQEQSRLAHSKLDI